MSDNKEQLISIPISDLIWNILGDDSKGLMCARVTKLTGTILDNTLKDSLKWKVEFNSKEGEELEYPILWRYSEWKTSADTYTRQKLWAHKERVTRWIKDKNIDNLARAIMKETRMNIEQARPIAHAIFDKGNVEVLGILGVNKLVTREEEL